jgi:hypothetical protein
MDVLRLLRRNILVLKFSFHRPYTKKIQLTMRQSHLIEKEFQIQIQYFNKKETLSSNVVV